MTNLEERQEKIREAIQHARQELQEAGDSLEYVSTLQAQALQRVSTIRDSLTTLESLLRD